MSSEDATFLEELKNGRGLYNPPPLAAFPLWSLTDKLSDGDSIAFAGSTAFREFGFALIPAHTWKGQGCIEINTVLEYRDTRGSSFEAHFQLESTDNYQSGPEIPDADRGKKPTVWTAHATWDSWTIGGTTDNAWRQITLHVKCIAGLHLSDTWRYHADGDVRWNYEDAAEPVSAKPICHPFSTPFDPTVDKLLRLTFRTSILPENLEVRGAASMATFWHPREGFGLED